MADLAACGVAARRPKEAIALYEQALAALELVRGPDHPDALAWRGSLAEAYYMAKRRTEAISLFERTLSDCERVLGSEHTITRTIRDKFTDVLR